MPSTIPANTACESPVGQVSLGDTCEFLLRDRIPNLLRLYLNPHVAQACYCLTKFVEQCWPTAESDSFQVFLANSGEEGLSGAVKLARYHCNAVGHPCNGLIVDPDCRWSHFSATDLPEGQHVEYIPALRSTASYQEASELLRGIGFLVIGHDRWEQPDNPVRQEWDKLTAEPKPVLIICSEHKLLHSGTDNGSVPDIVVFDDSVVSRAVPYGGFVASRKLYGHWNRRGMATFHSTTYQPNTISSLHFMRCLEDSCPEFFQEHANALLRIEQDLDYRLEVFHDLYNSSLVKLIKAVGFNQESLHVDGHYVADGKRRVFDGVAGVACSVRGHNPSGYVSELTSLGSLDACRTEVQERLHELTGLPHASPAVSGASAVEQALKLGLASQMPRNYVLALKGGFGGKTLFALTGTERSNYKVGLDPLYPHVIYVDPFAKDAGQQISEAFATHPIGVMQCELVQGVGGVRPVPTKVLQQLKQMREEHDCLLLVDEVQTGVYRTGPFVRSTELGVEPDLLTIGKAMSDMMFPFAMTLHSENVQQRLQERGCHLSDQFHERHGYEYGYRTVLNMLRYAEQEGLEEQVRESGKLLASTLAERLQLCPHVREIRSFGLLLGIELNTKVLLLPWLKKIIPRLYLLAMIRQKKWPLMMGFCQYEPNVFKLTPPLSTTTQEVGQMCETIGTVIGMSPFGLLARLTRELFRS